MEFAFDPVKSRINLRKHGVSLQRTEQFDFGTAAYDVDDSQDYGEVRYNAIGWLETALYTLTFTQRGTKIRLISVRKASRQEQTRYAKEFQR